MDSLKQHDVYKLVNISSVPKGEKIIDSRSVFKQKADGRFKARFVVQGHVQERGIDYGRIYAPVCRIGSIRTLLATACQHGWPVWQINVVVAFLQSLIDKDVFVEPAPVHDPRDSKTGEVIVYKPQRSLYGLAQIPVLWRDTIDRVLVVIGFKPTQSDPCVYTHGSGVTLVILTLYVDNILITGKDLRLRVSVISRVGDFCVLIFYICIYRYGSSLSVYSPLRRIIAAVSHTINFTCCILDLFLHTQTRAQ